MEVQKLREAKSVDLEDGVSLKLTQEEIDQVVDNAMGLTNNNRRRMRGSHVEKPSIMTRPLVRPSTAYEEIEELRSEIAEIRAELAREKEKNKRDKIKKDRERLLMKMPRHKVGEVSTSKGKRMDDEDDKNRGEGDGGDDGDEGDDDGDVGVLDSDEEYSVDEYSEEDEDEE